MPALALRARELGIGSCIRLGKGEKAAGGEDRDSILSDVFEALMGVIMISRGFDALVKKLDQLKLASSASETQDSKSELQIKIKRLNLKSPQYTIVASQGPGHDTRFLVRVIIDGKPITEAWGKSKQEAEQVAASLALKALEENPTP